MQMGLLILIIGWHLMQRSLFLVTWQFEGQTFPTQGKITKWCSSYSFDNSIFT